MAIVNTNYGLVEGRADQGVALWQGITYATASRFEPARSPDGWSGILDATRAGPRCPQPSKPSSGLTWRDHLRDPSPTDEDCLKLNVFAPWPIASTRRLPVMVWLHGGGFNTGSANVPAANGRALAKAGAVVVSLNHRLNAFGFTYADDLPPNLGMTDIVAALTWVRENIAQFGGDPNCVTIFGQSGGGSKVAVLMAMPAARGLFHRAIIQSASSLLRMATPKEARVCSDLLIRKFTDFSDLQDDTSVIELLAARAEAVSENEGHDDFRPVVDGNTLPSHPFDPKPPTGSLHIPLLIGTSREEVSYALAVTGGLRGGLEQAVVRLAKFMECELSTARKTLSEFVKIYPSFEPWQLLLRLQSEIMYRANCIRAAERFADDGGSCWMYRFDWTTAAEGGRLGSPHTMCIPFVFGTTASAGKLLGRPKQAAALSERVRASWVSFARHGDPNQSSLPEWPRYCSKHRRTMIFDDACTVLADPDSDARRLVSELPPYRPHMARHL